MDPVQGTASQWLIRELVTLDEVRGGAPAGSLTEDAEGGVNIWCDVRYSFSKRTVNAFSKHRAIVHRERMG